MEYPSNSQSKKPRETPQPEAKIEKVITGTVVRTKPSLGKRFKEVFIGGDARSVWMYVAYDILIPAVKDTVSDAISMGVERALFGDARGPSSRGRGSSSSGFTNYSNYSKGSKGRYDKSEGRTISARGRASHNFDEITLDTRAEAEEIIDQMMAILDQYDEVTISALYQLLGVGADFVDEKYGWTDLRQAGVRRVRNGRYMLDLPRPIELDK